MASKRISGITIELGADTTKLNKALSDVDRTIRNTSSSLRDINKLLQLNPGNTELLTQKQKALSTEIDATKQRLNELKNVQRESVTPEQWDALQREIIETETKLKNLEKEYESFGSVASQKLKAVGEKMQEVGKKISDVGDKLKSVGGSFTTHLTIPIVGAFGAAVKSAIDFESAFTGVKKTVDATEEEYKQLSGWIEEASTKMMSSKEDIAGVMEVAGQLGISGVDNLETFTKTMIMLGDTTNLSSDEAAGALARFLNITGESPQDVDKLGSAIVDLGNNFATDEASIVSMSTRLASAGTLCGLTSTDILGLATAMSSVGLTAEAGGTAMSTVMKKISKAVEGSGKNAQGTLETIASVSGVSAQEFANAWKNEPMSALQMFVGGLGDLDEGDQGLIATLDDLGLKGIRESDTLQRLALASGLLTDATKMSSDAYKENVALQDEANQRYGTYEAKLEQTKNKIGILGKELGERLLPYVDKGISLIDKLIEKWDELSPKQQDLVVKIGLVIAAIGPVLTIVGTVIGAIGGVISAIGSVLVAGAGLSGGIAAVAAALGPVGAAIALFTAGAIALGTAIYQNWDWIKEKASEIWGAVKEAVSQAWEGIKSAVTTAVNGIKTTVQTVWNGIKLVVTTVGNGIKTAISTAWNAIKTAVTTVVNGIKTAVQTAWNGIKTVVTTVGEGIKTAVSTAWNAIKTAVTTVVNGIKTAVQTAWNGIKTVVTTVGNGIKTTVTTAWENIKTKVTTTVGNLKTAIKTKWDEIKNNAKQVFSVSNWVDLGKNIIDGIISGVSKKANELFSKLKNLAKEALQAAKDKLKIKSPSKVFRDEVGKWIPEGMAVGIDANTDSVMKAVNDMSDVAIGSLSTPNSALAGANNSTVNYGGVNITVNARDGQSAREIAREVSNILNTQVAQQRAVFA